jgi:hypothetical protein
MDMEHAQVVGFAIERTAALQTFWNFYLVVATAILAAMATGKMFTATLQFKTLISLAFIGFAFSNLYSMWKLAQTRHALLEFLPTDVAYYPELKLSLLPPGDSGLIIFHLIMDCIVLFCIWGIPWQKMK